MKIAEKLQYYRELKGYTVNKLANLSGLSQSHVREIQLGERNPTIDTLELLCEALDINVVPFCQRNTNSFYKMMNYINYCIASLQNKKRD